MLQDQSLRNFPKWAKQGRKNDADPFVVAVAEVNSCVVISGETNGGPDKPVAVRRRPTASVALHVLLRGWPLDQ